MRRVVLSALLFLTAMTCPAWGEPWVDQFIFADPESAAAHDMEARDAKTVSAALGLQALQLQPPSGKSWRGGSVSFTMKVDPDGLNYVTARFWGGDVADEEIRLMLFVDGKQVGQRHLGEVDQLDIMGDKPRYPGKFFYKTSPLPLASTQGKTSVRLTIESQGGINGYAGEIEKYQKDLTLPSRGLYRVYTHTKPFFEPPADEVQGEPVTDYPVSDLEPEITIEELKAIVDKKAANLIQGKDHISVDDLHFLAIVYHQPWSAAYHTPDVVEKVVRALDATYAAYRKQDPDAAIGRRWIGYGPAGEAVHMLAEPLEPFFDTPVTGDKVSRRAAWSTLFQVSRDYHAQRRRVYTNQSMILDTNLYRANSGLKALGHAQAWPRAKALRLLHESIGLKPWSGILDDKGRPDWSRGRKYFLLTDAAMTKELGYVGEYGESVFDLALHLYEATRPAPGEPGDPEIKAQMVKVSQARAAFRYPSADAHGHRVMVLEGVIGWRDWKFPGNITYDQRPGRDGGPLDVAVATLDPVLLGYAQQMIEDNQVFPALKKRSNDRRGKSLLALAISIGAYETLMASAPSPHRLPMTQGQPDFVFADPGIGVVAFKHGQERVFASLYWRARYAINDLARVHHLSPQIERDATIRIHTAFRDSGHVFTMPDQTNEPFNRRHEKFYQGEGMRLAATGEKQPIAQVPADQTGWKPGQENIFAGKGDFYLMEYGPYLVAMNCTPTRRQSFDLPEAFAGATDLVTGETLDAKAKKVRVNPGQTMVLFR